MKAPVTKRRRCGWISFFFNLDADSFKQFIEMLDVSPARNPGLERLMAVDAPWDAVTATINA